MKIAQVCPYDFSRPGGVKNHIESLSKYLRRLGHEVKIIAPAPNVNQAEVYHFGRNRSLNLGGTKIDINIALGEEKDALKTFIDEEQFDIIHFHTFWNPALPFQIRRYSKAKHIATFHDTPKSEWVGKTVMPLAAKMVFGYMDEIISVSETQSSYIRRFSNRKIHIIPNGIDLNSYNQAVEPISKFQDGKFNILFLGRLEPRKGLIYALESFKTLKQENPNLRLIVAGDGDEGLMAEQFISENQLEDIELLGFVSEEEKLQLLKTADLYLSPAIYGESFGIVLLESMAMGTPMAGFANSGYLNVLTKEQKRFFVKPEDTQSLTKSIYWLMQNEEEREVLKMIGENEVRKYDWKSISKNIQSIYHSILSPSD